ncbi:MAG: hypothetical protein U0572_15845 [Phycisphaerales bacterium]
MTDASLPDLPAPSRRGPIRGLLDLFSSVQFGIVLLAILFVYMTVGSAGILYPIHPNIFSADAWRYAQMRQWRPFEMTEFEWFHWWPFNLLMLLISANIVVTTLRRIAFKPVNYGVWMIHSGIIVLVIGCVVYFGTKVEGDALVPRRRVVATVTMPSPTGGAPVTERVEFVASPGQRESIGRDDWRYDLEVVSIDPEWEMRSGEAQGSKAYSVNVAVRSPASSRGPAKSFMRQLIAGHPEHTEDVIATNDQQRPMQRAKNVLGKPLVDDALSLTLEYEPTSWFYLRPDLEKSFALYVRREGDTQWTQRPIAGMPLYNDYVATRDQVFVDPNSTPLTPDPLDIAVPPAAGDPFPGVTLRVTGYLRYAVDRTEFRRGGPNDPFNPVLSLGIAAGPGQRNSLQLEALNPEANSVDQGLIRFKAIAKESEFAPLTKKPSLVIRIPSLGIERVEPVRNPDMAGMEPPFLAIADDAGKETGYAFRVVGTQDDIMISSGLASVAVLELRTPKGAFRRWVFDDARLTRDATEEMARDPHAANAVADPTIEVAYAPGMRSALVFAVAGPEPERLRVISALGGGEPTVSEAKVGDTIKFPAVALTIDSYEPRAIRESKPMIVPERQRDRDAGVQLAKALVEIPGVGSTWLPYHHYLFDSPTEVLRRQTYNPMSVTLPDGQRMEVIFGRQRMPLTGEVALDEFILTAHVGGFTGEQSTIRDYTSMVRFRDSNSASWGEPLRLSVNQPVEHRGYWYFQAQWDPPDRPRFEGDRGSAGLNYTVLGVGNRNGVWTMLAGCCIAVIGMLYAFYVKPLIKRKQREAVYASLGTSAPGSAGSVADRGGLAAVAQEASS